MHEKVPLLALVIGVNPDVDSILLRQLEGIPKNLGSLNRETRVRVRVSLSDYICCMLVRIRFFSGHLYLYA